MPPKIEAAKTATFDTDDKRGQYARLVVYNYGVAEKIIPRGSDVNSAKKADLQKAFKSLVAGNLLAGTDGIAFIQQHSKKGADHPNVAANGLTVAYAQEVRPFLRRGALAADFGRRGKKAAPKEVKTEAPAEEVVEETEEVAEAVA